MRPSQLMSVLDREFLSTHEGHHTPVMVWGPPGVGKSQIIAQIASRHDAAVIDIRLSQMEPSDLRAFHFGSAISSSGRCRLSCRTPSVMVRREFCSWMRSPRRHRACRRRPISLFWIGAWVNTACRMAGDLRRGQSSGRPWCDLYHAGALSQPLLAFRIGYASR